MKILKVLLLFLIPLSLYAQEDQEIWDPFEPANRGIFWFNERVDLNVLEPVAKSYDEALPEGVKDSVGNFFKNLRYPSYLVSDLIQFKFGQMGIHTARFLVNTTVGVGGLFDPATDYGLENKEEDIASALAYREIPPGPYIVLPFLGPSTVRETVGLVADTVLNPLYWLGSTNINSDAETAITYSLTTIKVINTRADLIDVINTARESSVDYYLFTQGAFYQHRRGLLDNDDSTSKDVRSLDDE